MNALTDAFYEQLDDDLYEATAHTTGPWDTASQHAGPPSALLGGELERVAGLPLSRITMELLRPVPVGRLRLETSVDRPGRKVSMVSGVLADEKGPCVIGRAWGIRRAPVDIPTVAPTDSLILPLLDATPRLVLELDHAVGWHTAMDLRFVVGGGFFDLGPGSTWARPLVALVEGRDLDPIERVLLIADAGNGASASADIRKNLFINVDLTVHLHRPPVGEWVGIDAHSVYEPSEGVGAAFTSIQDARGPIGRGAQSLYLDTH